MSGDIGYMGEGFARIILLLVIIMLTELIAAGTTIGMLIKLIP